MKMESKRAQLIAKLDQRHKKSSPTELMANGKHQINGHQNGDGDYSNDFQRRFYTERLSIIEEMEQIQNELQNATRSTSASTKIEDLVSRVSKLQTLLNESTSILPSYEIRKANDSLQELQEKLKRIRSECQPQKRFAFTSIKPAKPALLTVSTTNGISKDVIDGRVKEDPKSILSAAAIVVQNRQNEKDIVLSSADCQGKDILLLDCQSCTIRLLDISTTVHAKQLIDCTIICHPVSTSIFIEGCERTVFVVACQQLRMHSSLDCDLYLHVTTAAIIEDCHKLRFAPYIDAIEGDIAMDLLDKSNLDKCRNSWNRVQDFNWLVADQPSPNWQILPADQWRLFRLSME